MVKGAPAPGEQGEPSFAQAAQRAQDSVAGAGIDIQFPPVSGLFDRHIDADASAVVAEVGQGRGGGTAPLRSGPPPGGWIQLSSGLLYIAAVVPRLHCTRTRLRRDRRSHVILRIGVTRTYPEAATDAKASTWFDGE